MQTPRGMQVEFERWTLEAQTKWVKLTSVVVCGLCIEQLKVCLPGTMSCSSTYIADQHIWTRLWLTRVAACMDSAVVLLESCQAAACAIHHDQTEAVTDLLLVLCRRHILHAWQMTLQAKRIRSHRLMVAVSRLQNRSAAAAVQLIYSIRLKYPSRRHNSCILADLVVPVGSNQLQKGSQGICKQTTRWTKALVFLRLLESSAAVAD